MTVGHNRVSSGADGEPQKERKACRLVVVNSVYRRMSVSVYLHQEEIWSGLYGSSSRVVPDSKEAMERFLTDVGSSRFCSD